MRDRSKFENRSMCSWVTLSFRRYAITAGEKQIDEWIISHKHSQSDWVTEEFEDKGKQISLR